MRARGDLGHYPAIGPMRLLLPRDTMRQHRALAGHERGCGFVARGF
jgi:hypothetical protein